MAVDRGTGGGSGWGQWAPPEWARGGLPTQSTPSGEGSRGSGSWGWGSGPFPWGGTSPASTGGGSAASPASPGGGWGGWGGGGGGGGGSGPPPWAGSVGEGYDWLPWGDWGQAPWASLNQKRSQEAQAWMNVMLPWLQQQAQQQQWGTEFDWRKAMDEWNQQFQQQQFGWAQAQDLWGREHAAEQLEAEREAAALAAYGRRWRPSSRWM